MGLLVYGDAVTVPFPFSDLSGTKKRPALVIASLTGFDIILCQITTKSKSDGYSVGLVTADFQTGSLRHDSNIRPNHLFTADSRIVVYSIGKISQSKLAEVKNKLREIIG